MEKVKQYIDIQKQVINIWRNVTKIPNHYTSHVFRCEKCYEWAMAQKLPVNGFEWVEELSKFNESFIKNYHEDSHKGYWSSCWVFKKFI